MNILSRKNGIALCKCDLIEREGFQGRTGKFKCKNWEWYIFVSAAPHNTKVVLHSWPCDKPLNTSFGIQILDDNSAYTEVLAECCDVQHQFPSSFTWKFEFPASLTYGNHGCISSGKFTREETTKMLYKFMREAKEMVYGEPVMEFTLSEHKIKLHSSFLLKNVRFSPTENSTLEALFKLQWEYNSKKCLSMNESYITFDALNSFVNFIYEDTIDDKECEDEDQVLGLLELGRCYMMLILTSVVELSIARDINLLNVATKIMLANEYHLESLKELCRENVITFGNINEVKDQLLDMGLEVPFVTVFDKY